MNEEIRTEMKEKRKTGDLPNACDHRCPSDNPYNYYMCCKLNKKGRRDEERQENWARV